MAETVQGGNAVRTAPGDPSLVTWTHAIYALHAASVLVGIVGAATIIGAFVWGPIPIVAVILNYLKRGDVQGTYLASHFTWQIRTFWYAVLWFAIGGVLFFTLIGIPLAFAVWAVAGIWVIYRVIRGWLALRAGDPVPL